MRIGWLTDIHLNFLDSIALDRFLNSLAAEQADAWIVGGDIGEAESVRRFLQLLQASVDRPVSFVLGNHDYYGGSFESVNREILDLTQVSPNLVWLSDAGVVELTSETALVGHGSWGDARLGNVWSTPVELNDFHYIRELTHLSREARIRKFNMLGDEAAAHLEKVLGEALAAYTSVICLTHVPPFTESAVHAGRPSANDWLPFFSCKAVGDVLIQEASRFSDKQIQVFCGHAHASGVCQILPNLTVTTGGARYGHPTIQKVLDCS